MRRKLACQRCIVDYGTLLTMVEHRNARALRSADSGYSLPGRV